MRLSLENLVPSAARAPVLVVPAEDVVRPRSLAEALDWITAGRAPTADELELARAAVAGAVVLLRRPAMATMPELPPASVPRLADHCVARGGWR